MRGKPLFPAGNSHRNAVPFDITETGHTMQSVAEISNTIQPQTLAVKELCMRGVELCIPEISERGREFLLGLNEILESVLPDFDHAPGVGLVPAQFLRPRPARSTLATDGVVA